MIARVIVDQQVNAPRAIKNLLRQRRAGRWVAHVRGLGRDLPLRTGSGNLRGCWGVFAVGEHDLHARCGEHLHDGPADAPTPAGDNGHGASQAGICNGWIIHPEMQ